jgi:hypothetical protein
MKVIFLNQLSSYDTVRIQHRFVRPAVAGVVVVGEAFSIDYAYKDISIQTKIVKKKEEVHCIFEVSRIFLNEIQ